MSLTGAATLISVTPPMKRTVSTLALAALSLYAAGCGGDEPAVATLKVEPSTVKLAYPEVQTLRLTWSPVAALDPAAGEPIVFVHLLDDENTVVRTFDHPFPQDWREGSPVGYDLKLYQSALGDPVPPGKYRLTVGLYGKENKRWALDGLGDPVGRNEYRAADVEVAGRGTAPNFGFSPSWLPLEPGGDRQVVARRWLLGRGVIRVAGLRGPGTVWLLVHIPEVGPEDKLVLEGGSNTPAVTASGSCGGVETSVSGPGTHEIEMPVQPPPVGSVCRIQLRPNFRVEPRTGPKRAISLENLAWIPAAGRARPQAPAAPDPAEAPEAPPSP